MQNQLISQKDSKLMFIIAGTNKNNQKVWLLDPDTETAISDPSTTPKSVRNLKIMYVATPNIDDWLNDQGFEIISKFSQDNGVECIMYKEKRVSMEQVKCDICNKFVTQKDNKTARLEHMKKHTSLELRFEINEMNKKFFVPV